MVVPDIIIHVKSYNECNPDVHEYGNVIQVCGDVVLNLSPMAISREHVGFSIKEEECNDIRFMNKSNVCRLHILNTC